MTNKSVVRWYERKLAGTPSFLKKKCVVSSKLVTSHWGQNVLCPFEEGLWVVPCILERTTIRNEGKYGLWLTYFLWYVWPIQSSNEAMGLYYWRLDFLLCAYLWISVSLTCRLLHWRMWETKFCKVLLRCRSAFVVIVLVVTSMSWKEE